MVTHAGKEFLKNCIKNAKFHNRILEENEMWRQWDIEQGLTMMVSDDAIRNRNKHTCKYHERKKLKRVEKKKSVLREKKDLILAVRQSKDSERWDHSGFTELYPEKSHQNSSESSTTTSKFERWDHSGFTELYPEKSHQNSSESSTTTSKFERKKCDIVDISDSSSESSSDDREVLEEFKAYKRKCRMSKQDYKHKISHSEKLHHKRKHRKHSKSTKRNKRKERSSR